MPASGKPSPAARPDERLVARLGAYLDGEATSDEAHATERSLFADPTALALLQGLRRDASALRCALDQRVATRPADRLLESISAAFERRQGRRSGLPPWCGLAAACLAFLAIGVGSGLWLAREPAETGLPLFETHRELAQLNADRAVRRALETLVSGQSIAWRHGRDRGSVTPLRTYRSRSGHWCREYLRTTRLSGHLIAVRALACRGEEGDWITIRAEPATPRMSAAPQRLPRKTRAELEA